MFNYLFEKYIHLCSSGLRNFKKKGRNYNFSCVYCGDSAKNKFKARAYLLFGRNGVTYYCHNCGISKHFDQFLKENNYELYKDYIFEKLKETSSNFSNNSFLSNTHVQSNIIEENKIIENYIEALKELPDITSLSCDHEAKQYIQKRKIPIVFHEKLYFCENFFQWLSKYFKKGSKNSDVKDKRIIIPCFDENENFIGFQARSIDNKNKLRYITINLQKDRKLFFGLNNLNKDKKVYVFEGPFDSMFLENSIATCGGNIVSSLKELSISKDNIVIVYDNEPKSKETHDKILQAIKLNYNVCIFPKNFKHKDINEAIIFGLSSSQIQEIIDKNTFNGLMAMLNLKSKNSL